MYNFNTNYIPSGEIEDEVRMFSRFIPDETDIKHENRINGDLSENIVTIDRKEYVFSDKISTETDDGLEYKKEVKRSAKNAVYKALKDYTKAIMPWGSLTGIRPTKLAYEYLTCGGSVENLSGYMVKKYDILPKKAEILQNIILYQTEYLVNPDQYVNLYVHIPFCATKCVYCSFITHVVDKSKKLIVPYTDCLVKEIEQSVDLIHKSGKKIYSIYVGGGTPTALPDDCFENVLKVLSGFNVEFTCEAGRPDTITKEKAEIMKRYGVTRVCVNPQSLCDRTLEKIGRKHTSADFFEAYKLIESYGFDINVDLIAGLCDEDEKTFLSSVNKVAVLKPGNVTVHTLSVKNGSALKNDGGEVKNADVEKMVDDAYNLLTGCGYLPYYLYRQKNMLGNLENIGYSLSGKMCANNVTTMEETLSVVACGAGAISKRIFPKGRIERLANLRDAALYIEQEDERLKKKIDFFTKQA